MSLMGSSFLNLTFFRKLSIVILNDSSRNELIGFFQISGFEGFTSKGVSFSQRILLTLCLFPVEAYSFGCARFPTKTVSVIGALHNRRKKFKAFKCASLPNPALQASTQRALIVPSFNSYVFWLSPISFKVSSLTVKVWLEAEKSHWIIGGMIPLSPS